jgi:hypothetical protein
MSSSDSVGKLLADIATLVAEGLRILSLADKRHWGPDEHEQVRALAQLLDEAKKDFQDLSPLVNGQIYYENDRKRMCALPPPPPTSAASRLCQPLCLTLTAMARPTSYCCSYLFPEQAFRPLVMTASLPVSSSKPDG